MYRNLLLFILAINVFSLNAQNVGIGQASPSKKLEVKSSAAGDGLLLNTPNPSLFLLDNTSANSAWSIYNQGTDDGLAFRSSNDDFATNLNTRLFLEHATGNIGIGTASPSFKLDVAGTARFTGQVTVPVTPTAAAHAASKQYVDNLVGAVTETDPTWSGTANTTASVGRTGNVGVGVASPATKLHVKGSVRLEGLTYDAGKQRLLAVDNSGNLSYRNETEWENIRTLNFQANNADQLWLLCVNNGGNNEILGTFFGQRSSGYRGAAMVDILISSRSSGGSDINGYINTRQVLHSNERYSLITCDYGGVNYIALRYEGQAYSFTELFYKGMAKSDQAANLFLSLPTSSVTGVASFSNSGTKQTFNTNLVGINTDNPSTTYTLHVNGRIGSNGINETSDGRLKKDIKPIGSAMDIVKALEGVSYYWRVDEFPDRKLSNRKEIGVIAQEVEKVLPEVVTTDDEGYKSVQYSHLVPVLIEAIKEQQILIEEKELGIQALGEKLKNKDCEIQDLKLDVGQLKLEMEEVKTLIQMSAKK